MVVGKFGKHLTFEVYFKPDRSAGGNGDGIKYLTFDDFQRNVKSRTTRHARILKKPKSEFGGPDLSDMTFTMQFSASLGVNPRQMLRELESCVRLGKIGYFIIGTKKIGKHKYIITDISESWDNIIKNGLLVSAKVNVTMEEYL